MELTSKYRHVRCLGKVARVSMPQIDDEVRYFCIRCKDWVKSSEVKKDGTKNR